MEAIIKFMAIHLDIKESIDYKCNQEKTTIPSASNAISYATNKDKRKFQKRGPFKIRMEDTEMALDYFEKR